MEIAFVDYSQKEEELAVFYKVPADSFYEQKFPSPPDHRPEKIRFYIHPTSDPVVFSLNGGPPEIRYPMPTGLHLVNISLALPAGGPEVRLRIRSGNMTGDGVVITDLRPVYAGH
mgnify:FL=1